MDRLLITFQLGALKFLQPAETRVNRCLEAARPAASKHPRGVHRKAMRLRLDLPQSAEEPSSSSSRSTAFAPVADRRTTLPSTPVTRPPGM